MKTSRGYPGDRSVFAVGKFSCVLLAGLAFSGPVQAEPGVQLSAGTGGWIEARLLLDLARPAPGGEQRTVAQMRLGAFYELSGQNAAGPSFGYGLGRRGHTLAVSTVLDGFLVVPLRVIRRLGEGGTAAELRCGLGVQARPGDRICPFASVDYRIRAGELHGRAGLVVNCLRSQPRRE